MRVLHTSRFYLPHMGGTERYIASLVEATTSYELQHEVLTSRRYAGSPGPQPMGPVHRIPVIGSDRMPLAPTGLFHLFRATKQADIIHVHDVRFMPLAIMAIAALRRMPIVLSTHGLIYHTASRSRLKGVFAVMILHPLLRRSSVVLASSESDAAQVPNEEDINLRVWINPVQLTPFCEAMQNAKENTPHREDDCVRLVYFGRLAPNKGVDNLFRLLEAAPRYVLTVIGTGQSNFERQLKEHAEEHRLPVRFLGFVSDQSLITEIAACDVIVLPSRVEGFGIVLVEAMATGKPIVANDIAPFRQIAEGSDVLLVDFTDIDHVMRTIERTAQIKDSDRNRDKARLYSWAERGQQLAAIYRETLR